MMRITSASDPLGRTTSFSYDARGLLASVTRPVIGTSSFQRNALGLLTKITDPNGHVWDFSYTNMGQLKTETDPLGNQWQYTYNDRGLLVQIQYPDGGTQQIVYDDAGNIINRVFSDGTNLSFTYNALNRLISANEINVTLDAEGRITNTQNPPVSFGATYDAAGKLATVTYADAFNVTYQYDPRGLLTEVEDSLTGTTISFTYDDDGRLISINRPNVNTSLTWDDASRLIHIQHGTLSDLQYTYNAADEVTKLDYTLPLDPANYLTADTDTFTYDGASQVSSAGYAYDERGRQTASPTNTFTWNDTGRLTGTGDATLGYNGLGNLIRQTKGDTATHYYHNYGLGLSPIVAEKDEVTGNWKHFYVWTPRGHLLYMIDAENDNLVRFYHFDNIGNTLFLTDPSGSVTDSYAYTPYGKLLTHQGTSNQPFTYLGKFGVRQEGTSGTFYQIGARFYDAVTSHYISREDSWPNIWRPEKLNPYQYGLANPISFIDVTGLDTEIGVRIAYSEKYVDPWARWWIDQLQKQRDDARAGMRDCAKRSGWTEKETEEYINKEMASATWDISRFQKWLLLFPGDPLEVHAVLIKREAPGKFVGQVQWWIECKNGERRLIGKGKDLRLSPEEFGEIIEYLNKKGLQNFRLWPLPAIGTVETRRDGEL